jgi:hypothetical protein
MTPTNTNQKPENPAAFPGIWDASHRPAFEHIEGMTLRDYFAAKAMQALIESIRNPDIRQVAKDAYITADAMLTERMKGESQNG